MLSAVILAAGRSERMGKSVKALLPVGGTTFIERIVSCLKTSDIGELFVVIGADSEKILRYAPMNDVRVLINDGWRLGQLSSLRLGVKNLSSSSQGLLFTLVDHPLVKEDTYSLIIGCWQSHKDKIVIPTFGGRKGHPAIFPRRFYSQILEDELPDGARGIIRKERDSVFFVPVNDPGVVHDVDTPEDFRKLIGEQS
jgi:molybdenum cofactor cytidylyltransferase